MVALARTILVFLPRHTGLRMLSVYLHSVNTVRAQLGIFLGWLELPHGSLLLVPLLLPLLLEQVLPHDGVEPLGC
jgi:hypothetical protein